MSNTQKNLQTRKGIGNIGEEIASDYLQRIGYAIIERNAHLGHGEIDIVARDGDVIVFVEVKTRRTFSHGTPFDSITHRKQKQLSRLALLYLQKHAMFDQPCRFDVISVTIRRGYEPKVELLKNAFEFVQ